jgi:hypothetical protein
VTIDGTCYYGIVGFPRRCSTPIKTRPRRRLLHARARAGQTLAFTTARLPSLLILCWSSGLYQANRAPPSMVRDNAILFFICYERIAGHAVVRGDVERFGGGRTVARPHHRVWDLKDFFGPHAGDATTTLFWERCRAGSRGGRGP